ncbi:hypothetical protein ACOMHN_034899 [Nucella lapillus]
MPSIDALLTQSQLRWSGHLVRMQDSRLPKQLFYGELTGGHRPRGRPNLRYKDTLKKSLQKCDIDVKQWEFLATNSGLRNCSVQHYASFRHHVACKGSRSVTMAGMRQGPVPTAVPSVTDR